MQTPPKANPRNYPRPKSPGAFHDRAFGERDALGVSPLLRIDGKKQPVIHHQARNVSDMRFI